MATFATGVAGFTCERVWTGVQGGDPGVRQGGASNFPRTILCAVDGSTESDLAVSHMVDHVRGSDAKVHIIHVGLLSPWTNPRTLGPPQETRLREQAGEVLQTQIEKLQARGVDPAGTHLRMGRATDEILRLRDEV